MRIANINQNKRVTNHGQHLINKRLKKKKRDSMEDKEDCGSFHAQGRPPTVSLNLNKAVFVDYLRKKHSCLRTE